MVENSGDKAQGRVASVEKRSEPYHPIDCGVHDELLARATLGRPAEIVYIDGDGVERTVRDRILDVFARERAEYMRLASGLEIRLDKLVRLDGQAVPPPGE